MYNRPEEIKELLSSMTKLDFEEDYEIVIIEDGSTMPCTNALAAFSSLPITYLSKANSGPGLSRNYGMAMAKGNYFIILDSDCLLTPQYLKEVQKELNKKYVDFYGGPDAAHKSFSSIQKAIDYSMTSIFTTGGIRGNKLNVINFQPRSFNMGISKEAFEKSGGFGKIHPGEDPDLTFRLWKLGFKSRLFPSCYVYHKRRISWRKFYDQVHKFGQVRPILSSWHPSTSKITYWFPFLFILFLIFSVVSLILGFVLPIILVLIYFIVVGAGAILKTRNPLIGFMAIIATLIQFMGYGTGFFQSTFYIRWLKKRPQEKFPHLFFN